MGLEQLLPIDLLHKLVQRLYVFLLFAQIGRTLLLVSHLEVTHHHDQSHFVLHYHLEKVWDGFLDGGTRRYYQLFLQHCVNITRIDVVIKASVCSSVLLHARTSAC